MDASQIIRALGGVTQVARFVGANRSAVSHWPRTGIPARYWLAVHSKAQSAGRADITLEHIQWRPAAVAKA